MRRCYYERQEDVCFVHYYSADDGTVHFDGANGHQGSEKGNHFHSRTGNNRRKRYGGKCGNPVNAFTRVVCGEVTAIDEDTNTIELTDEDGEVWTTEVGYASEFDLNGYYCIFFDTMGTDTIYDDEIAKLWKEVW